jgi:glucose/arabinose dehydrogenase
VVWSPRTRLLAGIGAAVVVVAGAIVAFSVTGGDETAEVDTDRATTSTDRTTTTERATTSSTATATTATSAAPTTTAPRATAHAGGPGGPPSPPPTTPPPRAPALASVRVRLARVASLNYPIAMAVRPSDGSTWLALKGGVVCRLAGASCPTARTVAVSTGGEQGLLGLAFAPDGGTLFTSYTNPAGDTRIDRHAMSGNSVGAGQTVFSQDQPFANHNGGGIAFGPDGRLWLGLGDGGSGGDPQNRAQNPNTFLGKMVRLDTSGAGRHQVVISGVRNPWRWSFDLATGSLWIADVGQQMWEEINLLPAGQQIGANLGWSRFEGTHVYNASRSAPGARMPIWEYRHDPGCSVTGGYVYRGARIPGLRGSYVFSDYCNGQLEAIQVAPGGVSAHRTLGVDAGNVVSFGQDAASELYVMSPTALYRLDAA